MKEKEYRASLAVGGSEASRMAKDWDEWAFERRLRIENRLPPWMVDEPTDAMLFGTAVHMALLEPSKFKQCLVQVPYGTSFATKEGKALKAQFLEFQEINPDAILLKEDKVWAIEQIMKNFEPFREEYDSVEQRIVGQLKTGHAIKGTLDATTKPKLIDFKTTRAIENAAEIVVWEEYTMQLAHYDYLLPKEQWEIIFIENVAPFRVRRIEIVPTEQKMARMGWKQLMGKAIQEGLMVR